jgi:ribosomal protein L25 (general stress protein Ctc)
MDEKQKSRRPRIGERRDNFGYGNSENGYTYKVKAPPFLYAPFEENQQAGMLEISTDGRKICEIPLFTAESCEMKKSPKNEKGFFEKLKNKIVKLLKQEK